MKKITLLAVLGLFSVALAHAEPGEGGPGHGNDGGGYTPPCNCNCPTPPSAPSSDYSSIWPTSGEAAKHCFGPDRVSQTWQHYNGHTMYYCQHYSNEGNPHEN